jgi:hypothetical protein
MRKVISSILVAGRSLALYFGVSSGGEVGAGAPAVTEGIGVFVAGGLLRAIVSFSRIVVCNYSMPQRKDVEGK